MAPTPKTAKESVPTEKSGITAPASSLFAAKKIDMTTMSKNEMVLQLALTISQLVGTISGLVVKGVAQADPRQFDPKKMEKIGEFLLGFDQLIIKINDWQIGQIIMKDGAPFMIPVGDHQEPARKMVLRDQCRKGIQKGNICKALSCGDKAACTRVIMRDLIGYSYSANGKTIKVKGAISEMLKVIFIGYKDKEGKKHQSMFELLADLTNMPVDTKTEIMQSVRTAKRILKIVSQLTFVEPKVDQQEKEEKRQEQAVEDEKEKE